MKLQIIRGLAEILNDFLNGIIAFNSNQIRDEVIDRFGRNRFFNTVRTKIDLLINKDDEN